MPKGLGWLQRYLLRRLQHQPMTFAELVNVVQPYKSGYRPYRERSMRRALIGLMNCGDVVATGYGGRRDPHRYSLSPERVAASRAKAVRDAWVASLRMELEAERAPGAVIRTNERGGQE
jgi:hypothetical protein